MNAPYPRRHYGDDPAILVCPRTEPSNCLTCARPASHRIEVLGYLSDGLRCPDHGIPLVPARYSSPEREKR
jgi:hypothetical protein